MSTHDDEAVGRGPGGTGASGSRATPTDATETSGLTARPTGSGRTGAADSSPPDAGPAESARPDAAPARGSAPSGQDGADAAADGPPSARADAGPAHAEGAADGQRPEREGRLRAVDIHYVVFPRAPFTRRGYDERAVDEFLSRVENELAWLVEEKADLREEVHRLQRLAGSGDGAERVPMTEEAQAQAVRLLAKAQQLADQYVAEAEDYSKRVSREAREQYDDVLSEARARAAAIVAAAEEEAAQVTEEATRRAQEIREEAESARRAAADGAGLPAAVPAAALARAGDPEATAVLRQQVEQERDDLAEQVAYLRTFSQITRNQLRAYLEALLADVEDQWGRADPAVVAANGRPRRDDDPGLPRQANGMPPARRRPRVREGSTPPKP